MNSDSNEMIDISDKTREFKLLFEKLKTDLMLSSNDSTSLQTISTESQRKKKLSNSSKLPKSIKQVTSASTKTKDFNLQSLISNEETREIGLFYKLLSQQEIGPSKSRSSDSKNQRLTSPKSSEISNRSESEKKSKSLELNKKSNSTLVDRKSKQPDFTRKSNSTELNRKSPVLEGKSPVLERKYPVLGRKSPVLERKSKLSKSPKEVDSSEAPLVSQLLKSLQKIQLSETSVIEKTNYNEGATGKQDLLLDSKDEVENYFKLFKQSETVSPESSDSGTLTPGSDDPESRESSDSAKSPKISAKSIPKSKLCKVSTNSELPASSSKSNLPKVSAKSTNQTKGSNLSVRPKLPTPPVRSNVPDSSVRTKLPKPSEKSNKPDSSLRPKLYDKSAISELHDQSVKSKFSDQSVRSKLCSPSLISKSPTSSMSSNLPNLSLKPNSFDKSVRPKIADSSPKSNLSELHDQSVKSKLSDQSVKSKFSDQSVRSKLSGPSLISKLPTSSTSSNLPNLSLKPNSFDKSVRPKIADSSPKSKLYKESSCLKLPDQSMVFPRGQLKSKFTEVCEDRNKEAAAKVQNTEINSHQFIQKLHDFVKSRRLHFLNLQKCAKSVKMFMDKGGKLKQLFEYQNKLANTHRKKESDDWIMLLCYWDIVSQEMNMIIEVIDMLFDSNGNVIMTSEEFHDFMRDILNVFKDILELICLCQNGFPKYARLCSSHEMSLFLNHLATFEPRVAGLFQKIRCESEQFTKFKKLF